MSARVKKSKVIVSPDPIKWALDVMCLESEGGCGAIRGGPCRYPDAMYDGRPANPARPQRFHECRVHRGLKKVACLTAHGVWDGSADTCCACDETREVSTG